LVYEVTNHATRRWTNFLLAAVSIYCHETECKAF